MKKLLAFLLAFLMCFSTNVVFGMELQGTKVENSDNNLDGEKIISVIVELEDKPLLEYEKAKVMGFNKFNETVEAQNIRDNIITTQSIVKQNIMQEIGMDVEFKYSYTNALNGFCVKIKSKNIHSLKEVNGVKRVFIDEMYEIPTSPQMGSSNGMINTPKLWNAGLKGQGSVVAVIDSGVDVNHEFMVLSDDTKVKLDKPTVESILNNRSYMNAEILINDLTIDDVYKNKKFPFCFDYADKDIDADSEADVDKNKDGHGDGSNHGVHVSGIVAANGTVAVKQDSSIDADVVFDGVAPECQIVGMKVFSSNPDNPGAATSDTLAAVEDAITLGVDAMNLSLGSAAGYTFYDDPSLKAFEYEYVFAKAREAGIIVAVAAGNDNQQVEQTILSNNKVPFVSTSYVDIGLVGSPGTKENATTIASIDNIKVYGAYFVFNSKNVAYYDSTNFVKTLLAGEQTKDFQYEFCGLGKTSDFEGKDVTGKIALIERGELNFDAKVGNATSAGAIGALIFNSEKGGNKLFGMSLTDNKIPAMSITRSAGLELKDATNKVITLSKDYSNGLIDNVTGNQMSSFTSWGCSPDLRLKPELTAPGGSIYSTIERNKYEAKSGTSMATPHIAGCAALLAQYMRGDSKFDSISAEDKADILESLMMSTATIVSDEYKNEYSPRRQGAGMVDLDACVNSDVYLVNDQSKKAKVELFEVGDEINFDFDLVNIGNKERSYELDGSILSDEFMPLKDGNGSIMSYVVVPTSHSFTDSEMYINGELVVKKASNNTSGGAIKTGKIISVSANSKKTVSVQIRLGQHDVDLYNDVFANGFFVEGFVKLLAVDNQPDLSIPYMGFYGQWDSGNVIDRPLCYKSFDPDTMIYGNTFAHSGYAYYNGKYLMQYTLGGNFEGKNHSYEAISFSPNGDHFLDDFTMTVDFIRNARYVNVDIVDDENNVVKTLIDKNEVNEGQYYRKSFWDWHIDKVDPTELATWDAKDEDGNLVEDGQYYYRIQASIDYENARTDELKIPVKVDTKLPVVTNINVSDKGVITFDATDMSPIVYATVSELDGNNEIAEGLETPLKSHSFTLDAADLIGKKAKIDVADSAGNQVTIEIDDLLNIDNAEEPTPEPQPTPPSVPTNPSPSHNFDMPDTITKDGVEKTIVDGEYLDKKAKDDVTEITLSKDLIRNFRKIDSNVLQINTSKLKNTKGIKLTLVKSVVDKLVDKKIDLKVNCDSEIIFTVSNLEKGILEILYNESSELEAGESYTKTALNYDIDVKINDKKFVSNKNIKVQIDAEKLGDNADKAGVYTVDKDGNLEYIMTYLKDGKLVFYPPHFSKFSVMTFDNNFDDIEGHWSENNIKSMASKHIVEGKGNNKFAPQDVIKKCEFVSMVVRALELKGEGKSTFDNVPKSEWYANYLSLAKDVGLIDGKVYNGEGIISRLEMARIISRAHAYLSGKKVKFDGTLDFTDVDNNDENSKFIGYAFENGLMNGYPDRLFLPVEDTTRAQAMATIYRLMNSTK